MALYSSGTVTVTNGSNTVEGSGTAWFGELQEGWMFVGPDGRTIGIANVIDNDTLTLTKPYLGSTASGQEYECFPTMSLAGNLATAFQQIASEFQEMIDGVGQGKFPDGTLQAPFPRFESDPDSGLRRVGPNEISMVAGGADKLRVKGNEASGDVVQSSAVDSTAGRLLKVGAFGLGASNNMPFASDVDLITTSGFYSVTTNTANRPAQINATGVLLVYRSYDVVVQEISRRDGQHAVFRRSSSDAGENWGNWSLVYSAVVGTVSEDSGGATGAIMERGSNANGDYVRFADGSQMCWRTIAPSGLDHVWTFPAAFSTTSQLSLFGAGRTSTDASFVSFRSPTTTSVALNHWNSSGVRLDNLGISAMAVGRWY